MSPASHLRPVCRLRGVYVGGVWGQQWAGTVCLQTARRQHQASRQASRQARNTIQPAARSAQSRAAAHAQTSTYVTVSSPPPLTIAGRLANTTTGIATEVLGTLDRHAHKGGRAAPTSTPAEAAGLVKRATPRKVSVTSSQRSCQSSRVGVGARGYGGQEEEQRAEGGSGSSASGGEGGGRHFSFLGGLAVVRAAISYSFECVPQLGCVIRPEMGATRCLGLFVLFRGRGRWACT